MQVFHRFSFNAARNGTVATQLESLNIKFTYVQTGSFNNQENSTGVFAFDISESDQAWETVRQLVRTWNPLDVVTTKFTEKECKSGKYLNLRSSWYHGYPMPDDDFGYISTTYDVSKGCLNCGVGWIQKAPFRLKAEPNWGKRQIMQLNWVFDEFFVNPNAYEVVFKPFGVQTREVIHHESGNTLRNVVQLVIEEISNFEIEIGRPPEEKCDVCGIVKFHAHKRGYFPKILGLEESLLFKTREYFGSGGSAWRGVIASTTLYEAMKEYALKGVDFYPLDK